MHRNFFLRLVCAVVLISGFSPLFAQESDPYRIAGVTYDIDGATREYPLSQAVPIARDRVFPDRKSLDFYLSDIGMKLANQRVFESVSIENAFGEKDAAGITPVYLTVHTVDTWNIIAVPYPSFDSNSGFAFKLKLKNYNFFGSMQELSADLVYQLDNNQESMFSTNLNFDIPFEFAGYSMSWNNDMSVEFPQGEIPEWDIGTGLNIEIPFAFTKIIFGIDNTMVVNGRDDDIGLYEDDPLYFTEELSATMPFVIWNFPHLGDLVWSPSASVDSNLAPGGIQTDALKGPSLNWGHALSLGRIDWQGNFRDGMTSKLSNSYSYNTATGDGIDAMIGGMIASYKSFFDRFGTYARIKGFYSFADDPEKKIADTVRGILNDRVDSDTAVTLNMDFPVKILDVDFYEMTGVRWTRYIGFEMQASPFFDMMLYHDIDSGRFFSFADGWYGSGMELIVYPKKMRSIYGRISVGFDLGDIADNGWKYRSSAGRDGESTRELDIGIGLYY